ncbi:c-type cytochrome [Shewanella pneumatophori]|uniref:C-type cytochrome n=1 Tax=Shewanella pneumatophori TaxID=314092 RepID=A0A9X2CIH9_9GAMM|nr:c-type cytochrome [Shewanella pneumatophori]MCL1141061.1 c-type cytochrome [Shewanella pneumatophori]
MKKLLALTAAAALTLSTNVLAQDGKAVYDKACQVCHSMGVAGAPKSHDAAAWEPRLGKGMDALVSSVKSGLNAMPPGGMCTDCSDEDYKNAIEYMSK